MRKNVSEILPVIFALFSTHALPAQIARFQHIVIVVQENRTPDNLFQGLCTTSSACSSEPTKSQYNIQMSHWLDRQQEGGTIEPLPAALDAGYELGHGHYAFIEQCDVEIACVQQATHHAMHRRVEVLLTFRRARQLSDAE